MLLCFSSCWLLGTSQKEQQQELCAELYHSIRDFEKNDFEDDSNADTFELIDTNREVCGEIDKTYAEKFLFALAQFNVHQRNNQDALKLLQQFVETYPDSKHISLAYTFLGKCYLRLGQKDVRLNVYRAFLKKYPEHPDAPIFEGYLYNATIKKGMMFPDLKETDMNGKDIIVTNLRGSIVVLDFWAMGCIPCIAENAYYKTLYEKYSRKDLQIIGIPCESDKALLEKFLKKKGLEWPQLFDGQGWNHHLVIRFGISSMPYNFIVDREGKIAYINIHHEELKRALSSLLP